MRIFWDYSDSWDGKVVIRPENEEETVTLKFVSEYLNSRQPKEAIPPKPDYDPHPRIKQHLEKLATLRDNSPGEHDRSRGGTSR